MTDPIKPPGAEWSPSIDAYHDSPQWSSTTLKYFRQSHMLGYMAQRGLLPQRSSKALITGTVVHSYVLENGAGIKVIDCVDRRSKMFRAAVVSAKPREFLITRRELEDAQPIIDAILKPKTPAAEQARRLLVDDVDATEYSYRWQDERTGVALRCRFDALSKGRIVDLKTTRDPSPSSFCRDYRNYEYHCQAALYEQGYWQLSGDDSAGCVCVAVRSAPPYEVAVYEIHEDLMSRGHYTTDLTLKDVARCEHSKDFVSQWELEPVPLYG